jgi:hypothetical protein
MWNAGMESSEPLLWDIIPEPDERKRFIKQAQSELANPDYHIYYPW